jgi:FkbM family methyltransferase
MLDIRVIAKMTRQKAEAEIQARVQTVPMGDNLVLARVLGNPKMFLHTQDLGFSANVMLDGYWEIWLTLTLARIITPGMVVVDVGANFGYYSLLMAYCVWPNGRVIAIEPNPPVAAILSKNLSLNGFTQLAMVEPVAAGAADGGIVHLFVPHNEPKNASIVSEEFSSGDGTKVTVPVRSVDSLCSGFDRVDLVKIDAEGAEIDVIAGMKDTISRFRPTIVLEFNAARYANAAHFLDQLIAIYGRPKLIGFDGVNTAVSDREILDENVSEDKLLLFQGAR